MKGMYFSKIRAIRSVIQKITKKNRPKILIRKKKLLKRKFVNQHIRSEKCDLIIFTTLAINLVDPYKLFLHVGHTPFHAKKLAEVIFRSKNSNFFFKILCFQQLFRFYGTDLINCEMIVKETYLAYKKITWGLPHSVTRKKWAKVYFTVKTVFFLKLVPFDVLHPEQRISELAEKKSNYIVDLNKTFPEVYHTQ